MDETNTNETSNPTPAVDPMAAINARLDAHDKTNESIMTAIQTLSAQLTAKAAATDGPAVGTFKKKIDVVEAPPKSPEDLFMDKMLDALQKRLGLAAGLSPEVPAPGGPCNLCAGEGTNAGGVVSCHRCMGSGVMPGLRLS